MAHNTPGSTSPTRPSRPTRRHSPPNHSYHYPSYNHQPWYSMSSDQDRRRTTSTTTGSDSHYHPSHPGPGPLPAQPIDDAVDYALDINSAANQLSAEVIAQITEQVRSQVIESLRAELAGGHGPVHDGHQNPNLPSSQPPAHLPIPHFSSKETVPPPPSTHPQHFYGPSPPNSATLPRPLHTPPTPDRSSEESTYFNTERTDDRSSYPPSAREHVWARPIPVPDERKSNHSPTRSATAREDLGSRYGERTRDGTSGSQRPPATRFKTNDDETVVEKMWQPLFDHQSKPTTRMNQFLRGIAVYLVSYS
jgi:hypothetical protein